ncbi:MAG: hypothetical protein J1E16_11675 [Muribaculaceae bacterium]|nr:hypothetical protein [Muribaculaceae bacterium]
MALSTRHSVLGAWHTALTWYLRWRHSKGYGVHSPYAYRFITEVLRPGNYGYYAYDHLTTLNRNFKEHRSSFFREARFLIRLAIFLHTKRIITYKHKYPEAQIVAKALGKVYFCCESGGNISFKEGDLLILPPGIAKGNEIVEKAIELNVPVFAINPSTEVRNLLEFPIKNGVLFTGVSKILLIPRQQMEYVAYYISFKLPN